VTVAKVQSSFESVRLLLVDDHVIVLRGLEAVMSFEDDLRVVAIATDGAQALEMVEAHHPDVVVLDLSIPPPAGATLVKRILACDPRVKVLILTAHNDDELLFDAVSAGAAAVVQKGSEVGELVDTIRRVHRGDIILSQQFGARLLNRVDVAGVGHTDTQSRHGLSQRELEVLKLLVTGATNSEIAALLFVSTRTVKAYLSSVFRKLAVKDRTAAATEAIRRGLVEFDSP
jgi:DNA-binding NarL/FixJ family response regulator